MPLPSTKTNFFMYFVFLQVSSVIWRMASTQVLWNYFLNGHLYSHPLVEVCIYNMYCTYIYKYILFLRSHFPWSLSLHCNLIDEFTRTSGLLLMVKICYQKRESWSAALFWRRMRSKTTGKIIHHIFGSESFSLWLPWTVETALAAVTKT